MKSMNRWRGPMKDVQGERSAWAMAEVWKARVRCRWAQRVGGPVWGGAGHRWAKQNQAGGLTAILWTESRCYSPGTWSTQGSCVLIALQQWDRRISKMRTRHHRNSQDEGSRSNLGRTPAPPGLFSLKTVGLSPASSICTDGPIASLSSSVQASPTDF